MQIKNLKASDRLFIEQQKYIGYSKGIEPKRLENIAGVFNEFRRLPMVLSKGNKFDLPERSIEEVKEGAKSFYDNHFSLHKIKTVDDRKMKLNILNIIKRPTPEKLEEMLRPALVDISAYELPVKLTSGHSMYGDIKKITLPTSEKFISDLELPFLEIQLGKNLTDLSIATYVHEIAHSQLESTKHYTDDYHNKETLTIFLEKVAALESDPTGELLRKWETMRFLYTAQCIIKVKNYYEQGNRCHYSFEDVTSASMYIESTLKGLKLFDMYQTATEEKTREGMLQDVQNVMDGKIQVEDILSKYSVTDKKIKNPALIKRHIVR